MDCQATCQIVLVGGFTTHSCDLTIDDSYSKWGNLTQSALNLVQEMSQNQSYPTYLLCNIGFIMSEHWYCEICLKLECDKYVQLSSRWVSWSAKHSTCCKWSVVCGSKPVICPMFVTCTLLDTHVFSQTTLPHSCKPFVWVERGPVTLHRCDRTFEIKFPQNGSNMISSPIC